MPLLAPARRQHPDPVLVPGRLSATTRRLLVLAVGTAALLPVITVVFRLNEYGDGAFFTLVATSDHPWHLFWDNFPSRATAYVVSAALPHAVLTLTGSAGLAVHAYQVAWASAPLVSLVTCLRIVPPERRELLLYPAAWFLAVGLSLYGFPSEVWLTQALAWPLMFALVFWTRTVVHLAGLWLLALAFAFTHEIMVLTAPVLLAAAVVTGRRTGRAMGWRIWPVLVSTSAAVAVSRLVKPPEAEIAQSVASHATDLLHGRHVVTGLVVYLLAVLLIAAAGRRIVDAFLGGNRTAAIAVQAAIMAVVVWSSSSGDRTMAADRYWSRSGVSIALAVAIAVAVVECAALEPRATAATAPGRAGRLQRLVVWCTLPMFVAQVSLAGRYIHEFVEFRAQVRHVVESPAPRMPGPAFSFSPSADGTPPDDPGYHRIQSTVFDWVLPYQSLLFSDGSPRRLLVARYFTFVPYPCSRAGEFSHLPEQGANLLTSYACSLP